MEICRTIACAQVAAHEQVRMFEIKLSQGAKPGKGGILPAAKVSAGDRLASRSIPVRQGLHQPEPPSVTSHSATVSSST